MQPQQLHLIYRPLPEAGIIQDWVSYGGGSWVTMPTTYDTKNIQHNTCYNWTKCNPTYINNIQGNIYLVASIRIYSKRHMFGAGIKPNHDLLLCILLALRASAWSLDCLRLLAMCAIIINIHRTTNVCPSAAGADAASLFSDCSCIPRTWKHHPIPFKSFFVTVSQVYTCVRLMFLQCFQQLIERKLLPIPSLRFQMGTPKLCNPD